MYMSHELFVNFLNDQSQSTADVSEEDVRVFPHVRDALKERGLLK